ncbi:glycosyltransferase [Nodosilinea nodulosa]|uniref:glycosyltransferase n=1 Tax=Nodosilinea nodulosa TaxID=416001 RepID=UPI00037F48B8|nr:glycosyltransferase [Nodosilinea nodulosa]
MPLLVRRLPLPQSLISVIVPVRDEAKTLRMTLSALAHQVDFQGHPIPPSQYEVIVFANNCTDESAAIVRQFARQHPEFQLHLIEQSLSPEDAHIGRVRQILMDEAYRRRCWVGQSVGIIASTDGDSTVDKRWIAAMLYEFERGADAVGGRTVTQRAERHALDVQTRATYLRFVGYRYLIKQLEDHLDPDPFDCPPRHYQFFGANFAVTYQMYALAGGLPPLPTGEDVAFHKALLALGARVRHSVLMRATTSARQQGRASLGLADRLAQFQHLSQRQQVFLVEPGAAVEAKLRARRDLRRYWRCYSTGRPVLVGPSLATLATHLAVPLTRLQQAVEQSSSFMELDQQIEQERQTVGLWQQQWGSVAIDKAIADLRLRLYRLRQQSPIAAGLS